MICEHKMKHLCGYAGSQSVILKAEISGGGVIGKLLLLLSFIINFTILMYIPPNNKMTASFNQSILKSTNHTRKNKEN